MIKRKFVRVLVTSFDKYHHRCTFHILVSVLLCHDLDSGMMTCEGSLT